MKIGQTDTRRHEWLEVSCALALQIAFTLAAIALGHGWNLFVRPAWLDEYHTILVAGQDSLAHSLGSLARGADFNPPLLTLMVRGVGTVTNAMDPSGLHMLPLRIFSFACVLAALTATFVVLRSRFEFGPSLLATFAVWSQPLAIEHAFEARFYGPWMMFAAFYTLALVHSPGLSRSVRYVAVSASAMGVCLIHYFGVITWGLALSGFILHSIVDEGTRSRDARRDTLLASLAGPAALIGCAPLYVGQRAALSVATWIKPPSMEGVASFLSDLYAQGAFVVVIFWVGARLMPAREQRPADGLTPNRRLHSFSPIDFLVLTPLAIVAFSYVVQPALVERYAIVGLLGLAPAIAWSLQRASTTMRVFALVTLLSTSAYLVNGRTLAVSQSDDRKLYLARAIETRVVPGDRVVFLDRHLLYPVANLVGAPWSKAMVYAEIPNSLSSSARDQELVERDVARVHARVFGFPRLAPLDSLRSHKDLWFVSLDDLPDRIGRWLPGRNVTRISRYLFLVR